jgi:hypothetical protein
LQKYKSFPDISPQSHPVGVTLAVGFP